MKVEIIDGCIACGVCETMCPDVFTVLEVSEVTPGAINGNEDVCRDAAKACPVSVIKIIE